MPIDIIAIVSWHFTVRFDKYEDDEISKAAGFGTFPISDWVKMLDALARICLFYSRAWMSTGTNGADNAVQTNLQMYEELKLYTYCVVALKPLNQVFSLFTRQPFWRLVHTLWHHLKCWRPHSTVTSIQIQRMGTNAKIRPEALFAIRMSSNAQIKLAFHRNGGTINCAMAFVQSKATTYIATYPIHTHFRCDNIKDCSNAEDEAACTFCAQDEFK